MDSNLPISLFVSALGATAGCGWVRRGHRATYDVLLVIWLMVFLTWTVIDNFAIFEWVAWPANLLMSSLSIASAEIAFRFYFAGRVLIEPDPVWSRLVFGGFLMTVAAGFAFTARFFVLGISQATSVPFDMSVMTPFLIGTLAIGIWGLLIVVKIRAR